MKGLISFSLWGNDPRYIINVFKNIPAREKHYKDWDIRIYHEPDVPDEILKKLEESRCQLVDMSQSPLHGMFHRFVAVDDDDYDAVIIRDADSVLTSRESAAVAEWIDSGKTIHSMRDAPPHNMKIQGGMWGCRPKLKDYSIEQEMLKHLDAFGKSYKHFSGYTWGDQTFMEHLMDTHHSGDDIIAHDDWLRHQDTQDVRPFPTKPRPRQHVGYPFIDFNEENEDAE
jgi:hypothetical protein